MDEKAIAKQLTEVIDLTNTLCNSEPVDRKLLKSHKKNIANLIRGYKNVGNPCAVSFEATYNQILLKLKSTK